jgi:glycosyltransferase involved in cell wall biosynthesis
MLDNNKTYSADIVVPCYNEEQVLQETVPLIRKQLEHCIKDECCRLSTYRLILVDDGSSDRTWSIISSLASQDRQVVGVKLSRNYGHQAALLAGLNTVDADVCISIDADLQDDITAISDMLKAYEAGNDMALGVRSDRKSDAAFKRGTANLYYWLLANLGVTVIKNHADFRLMSKRALNSLLSHEEVNLYLRGIIPTIGYNVALVPYTRRSRAAGETKYTFQKMVRLALDGITSFSIRPLRAVAILGAAVFAASTIAAVYITAFSILAPNKVVPGWASTLLPLFILGGLQILCIGIIGEYVGKLYLEVKKRPRFIIESKTSDLERFPKGDNMRL